MLGRLFSFFIDCILVSMIADRTCSRYPFHLRPKNKQIFNYIRMMGDMIHDLDLDQEIPDYMIPDITEEKLDGIRAYLAFSYLSSA